MVALVFCQGDKTFAMKKKRVPISISHPNLYAFLKVRKVVTASSHPIWSTIQSEMPKNTD